jgi:exonuclease SbcD
MIKILHLSDIHMGSGFSHGRINPETGWNTRLEDFVGSLGRCIDRAIAEPVDLVLFGGDAFPDATPAPLLQEAFARQFRRLADAGIPTVLLVGNHDQYAQGSGGASLSIYRTLGVPGFVVGDRLETHRLETRSGPVQVVTLPWLTRSVLLTRPETEGLATQEVAHLLIERLRLVLEAEGRSLDPEIPAILLAHLMSDTAKLGAERFLGVGKGFTVPLSVIARPEFAYVALGHVHRHQNLNPNNDPPVIYPGSLERVDFSEEHEEKGFVVVTVQRDRAAAPPQWQATWEFCPLPVRVFRTVRVDVAAVDNPEAELQRAIAAAAIDDAVVRLIYRVRPEQLDQISTTTLETTLAPAHSYTIQTDLVSQLARPRLPSISAATGLDPIAALAAYLKTRTDLQDWEPDLMAAAQQLLIELADDNPWAMALAHPDPTPPDPTLPENRTGKLP